jgi:predicted kinase
MEDTLLAADVERLTESLGQLPEPVVEPALLAVSGLPGTGKSYFCSQLAERLPVVILGSDALRKVLFATPGYGAQESSRLFQTIHHLIEELLKKGISLILDATNLSERHREYLYSIAEHLTSSWSWYVLRHHLRWCVSGLKADKEIRRVNQMLTGRYTRG